MMLAEKELQAIDEEWLELIQEARAIGLSIEEVREFLNQNVTGEHLVCT
ncbi:DNA-binding anti-repressor SinI [Bacillus sp. BRMEA1]|nr:anti-repressor SinI family protein [Neobacillus endophyticus]NRD78115.1 DNA-binding anti-repressor SinI [Neobacillus endophyticus]